MKWLMCTNFDDLSRNILLDFLYGPHGDRLYICPGAMFVDTAVCIVLFADNIGSVERTQLYSQDYVHAKTKINCLEVKLNDEDERR